MYTVNNIFLSALTVFSGTARNSFASPNQTIADAVRAASTTIDFIESERTVPLTPALYLGDNFYELPEDVDTVLDIFPASGRSRSEQAMFNRASGLSIARDYTNSKTEFAVEWRDGKKFLRLQPGYVTDTPTILYSFESLTEDGSVTVTGDANNADLNNVFYLLGNNSLDFDITPSTGTATWKVSGMTAKDISTITRDGAFTLGIYVPEELVGQITSLKLRVGSSVTDYYEVTATTNAYGGAFTYGFNIVRFERRSATTTGTVDKNAITVLEGDVVHTLTTDVIGVKIDAVTAHKGLGYNIDYYSLYHFKSATTGAFIETPTNTGLQDIVVADRDAVEIIIQEARKLMDMELRGEKAGRVYQAADRELNGIWGDFSRPGLYEQYRLRYPSKRRSVVTQYEGYHYE